MKKLLLLACLALVGCGPNPGDIYENLLTGERIKLDLVAPCDTTAFQEVHWDHVKVRYGSEWRQILGAFNEKYRFTIDSLVNAYEHRSESFIESEEYKAYQEELEELSQRYDTFTDSARINDWEKLSKILWRSYMELGEMKGLSGDCAFAVKWYDDDPTSFADEVRVIQASEISNDWKKMN